jgi:hypothetical protein
MNQHESGALYYRKELQVFQGDSATGEPMDEMTEDHLCAWLRSRGFSEKQTTQIVNQIDEAESTTITLP